MEQRMQSRDAQAAWERSGVEVADHAGPDSAQHHSSHIPNMPRAGDRFKDASAFEDACWNASRAYMGYNIQSWPVRNGKDIVDIRCSQYAQTSCKFRILAKLVEDAASGGSDSDSGDWIVDDGSMSVWTHNHGRHRKIEADPAWRPVIRSRNKRHSSGALNRESPPGASIEAVPDATHTTNAGKRRATSPADVDANDYYQNRKKIARSSKYTSSINIGPESRAQPLPLPSGPSNAARAYATSVGSPGPSGSVSPPPLPIFKDQPLSISELNQLLNSLSPLLAPLDIATALHHFGVDSITRFANLVFSRSEWVTEAMEERETRIPMLRRVTLMNALAAKRPEFEGR